MRAIDDQKPRSLCIRFLFLPLLHIPLVIMFALLKYQRNPPEWLGTARVIALIGSVYGVVAPFPLAMALRKSHEQLRTLGINPEGLCALLGIAQGMFPMVCGLALTFVGHGPTFHHAGFVLSVMGMGYWSWRERAFLFLNRRNERK